MLERRHGHYIKGLPLPHTVRGLVDVARAGCPSVPLPLQNLPAIFQENLKLATFI